MKKISCLISFIILFFSFILFGIIFQMKRIRDSLGNYDSTQFHSYQVSDIYSNQMLNDTKEDLSFLNKLSSFNTALHTHYDYHEILFHSIISTNKFFLDHENFLVANEDDELFFLKSMEIGKNLIEKSNIRIVHGRPFEDNDFYFTKNTIPIILGNSYLNYFNIGDQIDFSYLEDYIGEIIGFMENDSYYEDHMLDEVILIPLECFDAISEEPSSERYIHQIKMYLNKNMGFIYSDKDIYTIKREIKNLSIENGLNPYNVLNSNSDNFVVYTYPKLIQFLSVILMSFIVFYFIILCNQIFKLIKATHQKPLHDFLMIHFAISFVLLIATNIIIKIMIYELDYGFNLVIISFIFLFHFVAMPTIRYIHSKK